MDDDVAVEGTAGGGSTGLRGRLAWAAPLVLALFAATQFTLGRAAGITPWKGGGFGMFSTVDRLDTRDVDAWLVVDGQQVPVDVPAWVDLSFGNSLRRNAAVSLPARPLLEQVADSMRATRWWVDEDGFAAPAEDDDPLLGPASAVRLVVSRLAYDAADGTARLEVLVDDVVEVAS